MDTTFDKNLDKLASDEMSLDELGVNLMNSRVVVRSSLPLRNQVYIPCKDA